MRNKAVQVSLSCPTLYIGSPNKIPQADKIFDPIYETEKTAK